VEGRKTRQPNKIESQQKQKEYSKNDIYSGGGSINVATWADTSPNGCGGSIDAWRGKKPNLEQSLGRGVFCALEKIVKRQDAKEMRAKGKTPKNHPRLGKGRGL